MLKKRFIPYFLLVPLTVLFILPMLFSIIILVIESLGYMPALGLNAFTLKFYAAVLADKSFCDSFIFTLKIALFSSVLAVVAGFTIAYLLTKTKEGALIQRVLRLPLLIPHFTAAFMVFLMLSQSGEISRLLGSLRLLHGQEAFPQLFFDSKGIGIIVTYVWKEVPFAALVFYTTIKTVGSKFRDSAYNLGAEELQYVTNIMFPLCLPSISSTFAMLFAFNFGAFEVPFLAGPSYPRALPVLGYISYLSPDLDSRPETMAINMLITLICVLVLYAYSKAMRAMTELKKSI